MRVQSHRLFDMLLAAVDAGPEASITFSQATPPALRDYLDDLDPDLSLDWSGTSFQGAPLLRERVAHAAMLSPELGAADVVVTSGAAEANFLAMAQVLEPGDEVVTERPGWPQPSVLVPALGGVLVEVARREEDGWRLDVDEVCAAIGPRTKLVFLSNPSNPTGGTLDDETIAAIARRVEQAGAWLLVDEVYAGLEWDAPRATPAAVVSERGITTGSVSKSLGLQGIRIGWLACRDAGLLRSAVVLRESTSEIMNVLGEAVAAVALRPDRLEPALSSARAEGRSNLATLDAFVAGRPELSWTAPRAGLVGICRLLDDLDGDDIARRLLAPPYRTLVIPGGAFGLPHHLRLGAGGGPAARLELGLERLADLLERAQ